MITRVQKHPLMIVLGVIAAIVFALFGIARLSGQVDFNDYFAKDDPRFINALHISETYQRHDKLWLLLESGDSWLNDDRQAQLLNFDSFLLTIDGVESVSGYNQITHSSQQAPVRLKSHPRLSSVLSNDAKAVMLAIDLQPPNSVTSTSIWLNRKLEILQLQIKDYWQEKQVNVYFSGTQILNAQYAAVLKHDLIWFVPGLLAVFALMSVLFIRQWQWILAITLNGLITLVLTIGFAGWLQLTIAAISAFIPVVVLTLSLAYSAHLFFVWQHETAMGADTAKALLSSVRQNALALSMATITTVVGFVLLAFSPSPAISSFGILAAFAVLINYLLSQTLLLLLVKNAQPSYQTFTVTQQLLKLINRVCGYPKTVLIAVSVISVVALLSVSQLKINDNPLSYFAKDSTFNLSQHKIQQYFKGINTLQYNLTQLNDTQTPATATTSTSQSVIKPSTITFLFAFKRFLQKQPQVLEVQHIGDWIKSANLTPSQFNQLLHSRMAEDLLAAELSQNKQSTLVNLFLVPLSSIELLEFEAVVDAWLKDNLPSNIEISYPTSANLLFAHLSHDNAANMLQSFVVALLFLAVLIMWLKRSWYFGLIALLINALTLLWVFGIWQLMGGNLSLGGTIVLCMMLGIIVDDTLHLILKLPDKRHDNVSDSFTRLAPQMWLQLQHLIPVITFTTLTISVGFSLGLMSDFLPIFQLSLLSVLVMVTAWFFDVFILPVLYLAWLKGKV